MVKKEKTKINKSKQGKKSRAAGARFELKVRKDLEDKGWIVSKWMNNLEVIKYDNEEGNFSGEIKLIPAKHKFRGPGIPMAIGTGMPDFIAHRYNNCIHCELHGGKRAGWDNMCGYEVIGVEVKSNGYLDKVEKEKCRWLLDNHIFSKILIASKGKKRGEIEYIDFKVKYPKK